MKLCVPHGDCSKPLNAGALQRGARAAGALSRCGEAAARPVRVPDGARVGPRASRGSLDAGSGALLVYPARRAPMLHPDTSRERVGVPPGGSLTRSAALHVPHGSRSLLADSCDAPAGARGEPSLRREHPTLEGLLDAAASRNGRREGLQSGELLGAATGTRCKGARATLAARDAPPSSESLLDPVGLRYSN